MPGPTRKPLIAGNWKMNLLNTEAVALAEALKPAAAETGTVEVVVCPTFTTLYAVGKALQGSSVALGAQNVYVKEFGAYTGEISPQMLQDVGCTWTIIGHSERRQYFHESDAFLNEKLHYARTAGLNVMFCIGETLEEREGGTMDAVLTRQVVEGLKGLDEAGFSGIAIAYEPVWAIGTGITATAQQAEEAHAFVRGLISAHFGATLADAVRIQYGGSAKPENAAELIANPNVDGFLVGGAALKAESFAAIIKASAEAGA